MHACGILTLLGWVARLEGQVTDTSLVISLSSLTLLLLQQALRVVKVLIPVMMAGVQAT
jgi:hypothetical protein